MFGIGLFEFLIIAIVLIVFIKPKDLPVILNKLGHFVAKVKSLVKDITSTITDVAETEKSEENKITDLDGKPQPTYKV